MNKIEVLYICHTNNLGGAALSLYNMIRSLRDSITPIVLLTGKGSAYDLFTDNGVKCIVYPFRCNTRERNIFKHYMKFIAHYIRDYYSKVSCVRHVLKELNGHSISIVHSNSSVFTVGVDLAKALSAKHVWHIREFQDLDFGMQPFLGWKRLKQEIYSSDAVIAITKAVYDHWRLENAHNAHFLWDAVRSKDDVIYNEKKDKYFFFCAATLLDMKGTAFAVESFGRSGLAKDGYKLVLAGDVSDKYKSVLYAIMERFDITSDVEMIGYCNDIKPYMAEATAFLMCSRNEGLGRVTIEAMFYGCPVLARNTGGTLDFIVDKKNGFLFSDMVSCVQTMRYVASCSCKDVALAAQQFAVENFSEEIYGENIMRIYEGVLN